jgi:hypothetical protein
VEVPEHTVCRRPVIHGVDDGLAVEVLRAERAVLRQRNRDDDDVPIARGGFGAHRAGAGYDDLDEHLDLGGRLR